MAKSKKAASTTVPTLIRSDKNLLVFGLFGVALLVSVLVLFDSAPMFQNRQQGTVETERTYRVETAPAAITEEIPGESTLENIPTQGMDYEMDY